MTNGVTTADTSTHEERLRWPTRKEAATQRGCSVTTIRALERKGVISARNVAGTWRIDPKLLEAAEIDVDPALEMTAAELIREATNMVRQAQLHTEQMMSLIVAPSKGLQDGWNTLNGALITRLATVEATCDGMRKNAEEALSLQHERHMAEQKFQANEKRKNVAFETVMKQVPDVAKAGINAIMKAGGMPPIPTAPSATPASTPPATAPPPSSPPATVTSSPPIAPSPPVPDEPPPPAQSDDVEEESAIAVLNRLAKLSDQQIEQLATFGVITTKEATAFRIYRANIRRAAAAGEGAKDEAAIVVEGEETE